MMKFFKAARTHIFSIAFICAIICLGLLAFRTRAWFDCRVPIVETNQQLALYKANGYENVDGKTHYFKIVGEVKREALTWPFIKKEETPKDTVLVLISY